MMSYRGNPTARCAKWGKIANVTANLGAVIHNVPTAVGRPVPPCRGLNPRFKAQLIVRF